MITRPSPVFAYSSSHRIEQIGGWLIKYLSDDALTDSARGSRHVRVHDPRREPEVYRRLLRPLALGVPCRATGEDWIVIDELDARPLWQVGDPTLWIAVARYAAHVHSALRAIAASGEADDLPFLVHDKNLFEYWRERAASAGVDLEILDAYARASARLAALPHDIIHGDLYPANVLVGSSASEVWAVDWEMAGLGPSVVDVAALTSGHGLSSPIRGAMESAYFDARHPQVDWHEWRRDLDAARLHVSIQWLGWSDTWEPPEAQRHDWYLDALRLAVLF